MRKWFSPHYALCDAIGLRVKGLGLNVYYTLEQAAILINQLKQAANQSTKKSAYKSTNQSASQLTRKFVWIQLNHHLGADKIFNQTGNWFQLRRTVRIDITVCLHTGFS